MGTVEPKLAELVEQLQAEQRWLWQTGERIAAETYFEHHPGLLTDTNCALKLVYNEVVLREALGEGPRLEEFVDRFPRFADQLIPLFDIHRALESSELLMAAAGNTTLNMPLSETIPRPGSQDGPTIPGHEVLEELGRGGMGVVYKARHIGLNRLVAVKVILDSSHADPNQLARFRAEAEAVARLQHPNIVQIYDVGEQDGRPYFSLEFVDGGNLAEALSGSPQPARLAAGLIRTLARAVEEAHQRGIIHRDLKPSNILLQRGESRKEIGGAPLNRTIQTGDGSSSRGADGTVPAGEDTLPPGERAILSGGFCPKITDFGLAKHLGTDIGQTCSGAIMGTPCYMAPEQALGRSRDTGVATDVYALGAILYELLCGRPPFKAETRLDTLRQIVDEEPLSLSRFHIKVPPDLDIICLKCLHKDPARRYLSAEALAEDLERFLTDQPIHARRTPLLERSWRWCRRNPLAACLAAFTVMAAIGASVAAVWLDVEQQATLAQLHKTIEAEETGQHRLFNSLVAQARASRLSQRQGRRFKTLEVIAEATQLARRLNLGEDDFLTLRSEAASCLALTDVRLDRDWEGWPAKSFSIAFDGLLQRYARVDRQEAVTVYRVSDNALLYHLPGRKTGEAFPFLSEDGQYLALSTSADLRVWRLTGPEPALVLQTSEYSALAFHPDSCQFAVGTPKGEIRLHELPSGREVLNLSTGRSIIGLAFNPRKPQIAATGEDGAQILELPTGKVAREFGRGVRMTRPAWHPEGHLLAVVGSDARITIWDIPANRLHRFLEGFKNSLTDITFNHAGDLLASTGWEGFLRLWDPHTGRQLFSTGGPLGIVRFSPDDRRLAGSLDGTRLGIWQVGGRHEYRTLVRDPAMLDKKYPAGIATSPKYGLLAMAVGDGIQVSDLASGADLAFLRMLPGTHQVSFEPSGALLTNSSYGVWRWPVQEVKSSPGTLQVGPPQQLLPEGYLGQIDVSADGRVMAMAMSNTGVCVFRKGQSQLLWLDPHKDVRGVGVSPDGQLIATASFAGTGVRVWESQGGKLVKELVPEEGRLRVEFSPNGKWLATGWSDHCCLWSTANWQQNRQFGEAGAFAFSPDSTLLAQVTNGGSIRLVDSRTGTEYVRLEDPSLDRGWVRFSADGTQIVTNNDNPSVHVWDLRTIRSQLVELDLDWKLPAFPAAATRGESHSWRIQVDPGAFGRDAGPYARPALARYTLAMELQPFNAEGFYQRAVAHGLLEQWSQALEDCTKSLLMGPQRVEAHYLRGQILQRLGRPWEAFGEFSLAVKLEPTRVPTPEELQKILSADLHDAEGCNDLAWEFVSGLPSDYVPGLAVFLAERVVLLNPGNWYYKNTLGVAYYRLGRWQQAAHALENSLAFSNGRFDAFDLYYLCMVYHRLGRAEPARQCFERANQWWKKHARLSAHEKQELTSSRAEAAATLGITLPAKPVIKASPAAPAKLR